MDGWEATVVWSLIPGHVTWRLRAPYGAIRYLKVLPLGQESPLTDERDRLAWAANRLPVPRVLGYGAGATHEWLITAGLDGANAVDYRWRTEPSHLVPLLGEGLRRFHAVAAAGCPFDSRLEGQLRLAQERAAAGLVNADEDLHRDHGPITVGAAIARLLALRPQEEDLVVCHGDACVPNMIIDYGGVSGYVDLGKLGVADRWWDLAVATWSVTWNFGPGWEDRFLDAYGIERDPVKQAFYRLLYDLTP